MRLIDADALIAQLKCDTKDCDKCPAHDYWFGCGKIKEFISNAPTIDAVPVVSCKDCKWSNVYQVDSNFQMERWCDGGFIPKSVQDYDYCSWGERKDDETDRR